ncbi:MAG TPA: ABC transporter ATP-binding protein [Microthrixaceae bacterium]|nr:ABC transporter ATP-binding protein [Microthrixaceae bacterium]
MLQVEGITKRFAAKSEPVEALRGVDLNVERGSFAAVLGASGCGKTTLLRIIAGFERPDGGQVSIDGRVVAAADVHIPPERRNVGIVAQDGALFPHLDVASNIAYGLDRGWKLFRSASHRAERAERVEELLELVGLPGIGRRRPDELSGGQQQRIALARALAPRPSMILLDEPFSALDAGLRVEVREQVRDVLKSLGTTAVLVTHDQSEALSMADHVAIMRDGKVVQYGSPSEIYAHPSDTEIAGFLGDAVLLPGTVRTVAAVGATLEVAAGSTVLAVAPGPELEQVDCVFGLLDARDLDERDLDARDLGTSGNGEFCTVVLRPEQFELADTGLPATVSTISFYGHDGLVRLDLDGLPDGVTVRCAGKDLPRVGQHVKVRVVAGTLAHISR